MPPPLISQVTVGSTAQSLTELGPESEPAAVLKGEDITSPPSKEQLGKMLVQGKFPSTPATSKTFLSQLLSAILRLGNWIGSLAGTIVRLFTSSQPLLEQRPVTQDEAIAAVLAQQKNRSDVAKGYSATYLDSTEKVIARTNKYANESALPGLRSTEVGGKRSGSTRARLMVANSYFDSNIVDLEPELPALPLERHRSNFSGTVASNHAPLAQLVLELASDRIAALHTQLPQERAKLIAQERAKVHAAIKQLDGGGLIGLSDTSPAIIKAYQNTLEEYWREPPKPLGIEIIKSELRKLDQLDQLARKKAEPAQQSSIEVAIDDLSETIDPTRQSYREALEKYLVIVELQMDIAAVISDIQTFEIEKSKLIAADDAAKRTISEDTQLTTMAPDAIESQTQQRATEKGLQSFDATVEKLAEDQQRLELIRKTLAQQIEKFAGVVFSNSPTTSSSSVPLEDSGPATPSQLVPAAIPNQKAIPKRGILKKVSSNADKACKKEVSFDLLVETRSKPKWKINPDNDQLEKESGTTQRIELFRTLSSIPQGRAKGRLTQEQRLFLFLQENGLIASDTLWSTDTSDEELDWNALTKTAERLKQEEQELSRDNQRFNATLSKAEKSSLARPEKNQQFIYWKPEKMTLREWALIGSFWPFLNHPHDLVGARAEQLKTEHPSLFKGWDPKKSFVNWYGPIAT